jgi:hypothetical protein
MARTTVGYPEEPSRKATIVAGVALAVAGAYVVKRNKAPIVKIGATVAGTVLAQPLALWLTRMGLI